MLESIPLTEEERKLRRAARREKQRQANIGRARKMHVARVEKERSGCSQPLAIQDEKHQLHVAVQAGFTGIGVARSILRTLQQVVGSRTMRAALKQSN